MKYEQLERTNKVELVSVGLFAKKLLENNTRGYNYHKVHFYEDYISLSAPKYYGSHDTLILTREELYAWYDKKETMYEYYSMMLEIDYLPLYKEYIIKTTFDKLLDKIDDDFVSEIKKEMSYL